MKWRPISTAPKDGTYILGVFGDNMEVISYMEGLGWSNGDNHMSSDNWTHWQELPEPPEWKIDESDTDKLLNIDLPEDAREYIETFSDRLMRGKEINRVKIGGRWIEFSNMTDDEAIRIARSLYLDIELPSRGESRQ